MEAYPVPSMIALLFYFLTEMFLNDETNMYCKLTR